MSGSQIDDVAARCLCGHRLLSDGALSEFGKLGAVCVGNSHARAQELYLETVDILDREGGA